MWLSTSFCVCSTCANMCCLCAGLTQIQCPMTRFKSGLGAGTAVITTLEGCTSGPTASVGHNAVFQLLEFGRFRLDDPCATWADLRKLPGSVFRNTPSHYSRRVSDLGEFCGYAPDVRLSNHGFRAAFLTHALLAAGVAGKSWQEAWAACSLVEGWALTSRSQVC